ncbi:TPA: hypothetical protein ACI1IC_002714 [Yersinia enterocolitica]
MLINFILPYFLACYAAAYSVQQALEGLGFASSNFIVYDSVGNAISSYWSVSEAVLPVTLFLIFILTCIFICMLVCGWLLGKRYGLFLVFTIIIFPGLLSLFGIFPNFNWLPNSFVISGTGYLGGEVGLIILLLMGFLVGWCFIILLNDIFDLRENFRQYYDIMLLLTALVSGVFWVADSANNAIISQQNEVNQNARNASGYLLAQVNKYYEWCRANTLVTESCQWSSRVQEKLNELASMSSTQFSIDGPDDTSSLYLTSNSKNGENEKLLVRKQIASYNAEMCPEKNINSRIAIMYLPTELCQETPVNYCFSFPNMESITYLSTRTALSSECVIPTLVTYTKMQKKMSEQLSDAAFHKHYRWIWFIFLAFIIGGKVANIIVKIMNVDTRSKEEKNRLKKFLFNFITALKNVICYTLIKGRTVLLLSYEKYLKLLG